MIATEQGFAKRTEVDEFPVQARGGSGLKAAKIDKARGKWWRSRSPTRRRVRHQGRCGAGAVGFGAAGGP